MRRFLLLFFVVLGACCAPGFAAEKFQQPGPVALDKDGEKWAQKTLKKLNVEQRVGQVLMMQAPAEFMNVAGTEYARLRDIIQRYHLGGFTLSVRYDGPLLFRQPPYEAAEWTNQLQQLSDVPLIFAADFERGLTMRLLNATPFPHAMAFGAAGSTELAENFGRITAQESRAIGVQWNFFPVADVNSNPANPIINTRSFGEDPQQVGELAVAYIRGSHQGGMLATAKHFPGHGDTATDTHLSVAQVTGDKARLESVELPPFQKSIDAGVDAVMVAHVSVPALEPDPNKVATTSALITTQLLKNQMGFKGIVITDALDMNALTRLYVAPGQPDNGRAAVEAFKAGADVLLQPANVPAAYNAVLAAVHSGEISQARLEQSVLKVLRAKASVGLHKAKLVDVNALPHVIADPANVALGQKTADAAVTLLRDGGMLPLRKTGTARGPLAYGNVTEAGTRLVAVLLVDDLRAEPGREFEKQLRARVPDATVLWLDPRVAAAMSPQVLAAADAAQNIVVAAYVAPTAGKVVKVNGVYQNTVSLQQDMAQLLTSLLAKHAAKTTLIAMGSPYLAQDFPAVRTYLCTFSNTAISEISAAKALFGEMPVHGRLPVTIPNFAARGSGINREVVAAGGNNGKQSSSVAAR
jgi:beta-N-acetylhexosaminidase